MNYFPSVDPIPLPAPVWMFKSLHILTLSLHFIAVMLLLGGLLLAVILNFLGTSNKMCRQASASIAKHLPLVMTYVINLGIPPLLFAQVLYGVALYTSSVLIGAYWIAVVFLLMACYWMLYQFSDGVLEGKQVAWKGLVAWCLAGCISRILSINMTLMIKPEVWNQMYSATASGVNLPPHDPTLMPRWLFMLSGGFTVSGFWLVWIAGRKTVVRPLNTFLAGLGGMVSSSALIVQAYCYYSILKSQPQIVINGIHNSPLLNPVSIAWYCLASVMFVFAIFNAIKKPCSQLVGYLSAICVFLLIFSWVILRDGIRDLTLLSNGFNVWHLPVYSNWSVVIAFFLVFGWGIGTLVWLISVMMRAKPIAEGGA